jgi:transcriptional regulator with XRE-family HTH domain
MPRSTPRRAGREPREGARFAADVVAGNVRAWRLLRELEQTDVAERMASLGHSWSQSTVSQAERGQRHLTVAELLSLAMVLDVPVPALLDPTGPDGLGRDQLDLAPAEATGPPALLPALTVSAWVRGISRITLRWNNGPAGLVISPAPKPPVTHSTGAIAAFAAPGVVNINEAPEEAADS